MCHNSWEPVINIFCTSLVQEFERRRRESQVTRALYLYLPGCDSAGVVGHIWFDVVAAAEGGGTHRLTRTTRHPSRAFRRAPPPCWPSRDRCNCHRASQLLKPCNTFGRYLTDQPPRSASAFRCDMPPDTRALVAYLLLLLLIITEPPRSASCEVAIPKCFASEKKNADKQAATRLWQRI